MLAATCRVHGLDAVAMLEAAGLPQSVLARRDGRVPLAQARAAWEVAARASGDPCFGLHAGERMAADDFDVLGYASRAAPTLGQMLERVTQLGSLFTEDGTVTLALRPHCAVLRHSAVAPLRHVTELMFAAVVVHGQAVTGERWSPLAMSFKHAAPPDTAEHARIFGPKVRFGAPADELHLAPALLALPLRTHEPGLAEILDDYLRLAAGPLRLAAGPLRLAAGPGGLAAAGGGLAASQVGAPADVLSDVSEAMAAALPRGEPRLEGVARSLCVTPRTLQRRLRDAGTSFQKLLDHLRYQLALQYLESQRLPTSKLALLLGFSEPSAFYRAFRRWTGHSPAELDPARE